MATRMSHPPGTPSWVALSSPDLDASVVFYGGLFGWEAITPKGLSQATGYVHFVVEGRRVAALTALGGDAPPMWTTHVTVADADARVAAARLAGADVLLEPRDVLGEGRTAVLFDPAGAVLALWEPGDHKGSQLVDEPGTLAWTELATRDPEASTAFYGTLFGWTAEDAASGHTATFALEGRPVAGLVRMTDAWPAEIPAHWMPYFAVEDADAAAERATALGGAVAIAPFGTPQGRIAVLSDPHGAVFSVIALTR